MSYRRVVGLGLCVVDHIYVVTPVSWEETRLRYTERRVAPGGMTTTALAQAARLGCNAHVLSVVGDDEGGQLIGRSLDGTREAARRPPLFVRAALPRG